MREINPKETTRAYAFEMWMQAPMPMVTFFKTLISTLQPQFKAYNMYGITTEVVSRNKDKQNF